MKLSKTLSALAILAILAPMPAAASGLTNVDQGRSARKSTETLRERRAERRQNALKRAESRRGDRRERQLSSARMHRQLQLRLREMRQRLAAAHRRAIRRRF